MVEEIKPEVVDRDDEQDTFDFLRRLRQAMEGAGGRTAVSNRSGIPERSLARYLSGESEPKRSTLGLLAITCGVSLDWLVLGDDLMARRVLDRHSARGEDTAAIRQLKFRASAGRGQLVIEDAPARVPFPRSILTKLYLTADRVRLLEATGDSMAPTIKDGDPLLVDIGADGIIDGKIYAFTIGDEAFVKRLRRVPGKPGKILIVSDNRDLYPEAVELPEGEDFRIIGRVRWVGRSL